MHGNPEICPYLAGAHPASWLLLVDHVCPEIKHSEARRTPFAGLSEGVQIVAPGKGAEAAEALVMTIREREKRVIPSLQLPVQKRRKWGAYLIQMVLSRKLLAEQNPLPDLTAARTA